MIFFKGRISLESLVNYLNGTIDDSIRIEIDKWIDTSHENRDFFFQLREIWQNHEDLSSLLAENRKGDWSKVAHACKTDTSPNIKRISKPSYVSWFRKIAAAILLLMFTTLGYFAGKTQFINPISDASLYHEIIVPTGEKSELKLSDGTVMWINAGSTVRFPNAFNGVSRDIWLNGEAYFEVAHDKHRPFLVHTSDVDVKVYGTKFNLKAYENEDIIEATLIEGLVSLETRNLLNNVKEEVFLEPNRKAIYLKKKPKNVETEIIQAVTEPLQPRKIIISNPVNVEPSISWREGKLEFSDETFENIAVKLERRFGVIIQMDNDKVKKVKYSGVLKNISIEQALKAIQLTADFTYVIDDNTVIITSNERKKDKNLLLNNKN